MQLGPRIPLRLGSISPKAIVFGFCVSRDHGWLLRIQIELRTGMCQFVSILTVEPLKWSLIYQLVFGFLGNLNSSSVWPFWCVVTFTIALVNESPFCKITIITFYARWVSFIAYKYTRYIYVYIFTHTHTHILNTLNTYSPHLRHNLKAVLFIVIFCKVVIIPQSDCSLTSLFCSVLLLNWDSYFFPTWIVWESYLYI